MERHEKQKKSRDRLKITPEWAEGAGQRALIWPYTLGHISSTRQFSRLLAQRWTVLPGQPVPPSQTDESSLYLIRLVKNLHVAQLHRVIS